MKLAAANADCKWCLDEIEAARDVQSSLVKELCLWIRVNRDQLRLERRQDLQLKLLREDQFRTRIAMTAAVQLVEAVPLLADRHRRVERSAMRDPATARM